MRVTLGVGVTRAGVDELITGLWSFANVLGLLTDVIGERTAAAGVTVDGLLVKDAGIPEAAVTAHEAALAILESQIVDGSILARIAAAETISAVWTFSARPDFDVGARFPDQAAAGTQILGSFVTGDPNLRLQVLADGTFVWGPGNAVGDTNLFRSAANTLRTNDSFVVGINLFLSGGLFLSNVTPASFSANQNDFGTGNAIVQRLENTSGSTKNVTGFAGGSADRVIIIRIVDASFQVDLLHQSASSIAANRMALPGGATFSITGSQAIMLWYDTAISRWVPISSST